VSEEHKVMVRCIVEGINAGDIGRTVDEFFAPRAARRVKRLSAEFYSALPDWREEIVELVAEDDTVAGRFRCSGTHPGKLLGEAHGQAKGRRGGVLPQGGRREVRGPLGAGGRPEQAVAVRVHAMNGAGPG